MLSTMNPSSSTAAYHGTNGQQIRNMLEDLGVIPKTTVRLVEEQQPKTPAASCSPPASPSAISAAASKPSTSLDVSNAPKPAASCLLTSVMPSSSSNGRATSQSNLAKIPKDVMEGLYDRFLRHCSDAEQSDIIRICFNIEKAHWFYTDHYCSDEAHVQTCPRATQFEFFRVVFQQAPLPIIKTYQNDLPAVLEEFSAYKTNVPTYGACILNRQCDKVLLILSFSNTFGFPKGKINQAETAVSCAIREVQEEVGIDVRDRIDAKEYLEIDRRTARGKSYTRLYIVEGVEERGLITGPCTKGEVRKVVWWPIDELIEQVGRNKNRFWAVQPFIKPLCEWLAARTNKNINKSENNITYFKQHQQVTVKRHQKQQEHVTPAVRSPLQDIFSDNLYNVQLGKGGSAVHAKASRSPVVFSKQQHQGQHQNHQQQQLQQQQRSSVAGFKQFPSLLQSQQQLPALAPPTRRLRIMARN